MEFTLGQFGPASPALRLAGGTLGGGPTGTCRGRAAQGRPRQGPGAAARLPQLNDSHKARAAREGQ